MRARAALASAAAARRDASTCRDAATRQETAIREVDTARGEEVDAGAGARIDAVLDALQARGLLSDARAAEALLHAKAARYGTRRLRQALQARALPADVIEDALRRAPGSDWERACALWRRRFGQPPADAREHARQLRFLLARGFEAELAQRVIRSGGDAA